MRTAARDLLGEVNRVATGPLAAGFADADRHPPVFDPATGSVALPESLRSAYRVLWDGEWWRLGLPAELGGYGVPPTVQWAAAELMLGANPAAFLYLAGPTLAAVVHGRGTAEQRHWAKLMIDRGWGATMVLTEPDAGSDVGAGRTRAVRQPDGRWHLEGVKRFITSAEHDLTENIVHLVLARPEGAGHHGRRPAPRGCRCSWCPSGTSTRETGELGERNGVFVTHVEHKMGLKASTTCELTFGATRACRRSAGCSARCTTASRRCSTSSSTPGCWSAPRPSAPCPPPTCTALDYARQPGAGPRPDPDGRQVRPRVTIMAHPDVRRMLMLQKAYAEGLRALYLYTASFSDQVQAGRAAGVDVAAAGAVNDLLLPVVKGVGAERATEMLQLVPADPRRVRLPAGLPDRAVPARRQDRLAVRGHHRDPVVGPALPQDHPRPRAGLRPGRRGDPRLPERAGRDR